ncbi:MAG: branched-chain amino acid aminotransferase [Lentimonas sp.]|jgi:branched-chain amino acid aminotransferase
MTEITIISRDQNVTLDPLQSGFAHGFGLFETMRFRHGALNYWPKHWARLQASAQMLQLELGCSREMVCDAIRKLVNHDEIEEAMIKLSLVRDGEGSRLFVYARPLGPIPTSACLRFDPRYPINERSMLAGHKSHNYMENISLLQEARAAGYYDVLRVNTMGEIAETAIANLFLVVAGELWTPSLEAGALPGVMRSEVIAQESTHEARFGLELLQQAEAVFLTNAACGILPVERIEGDGIKQEYSSQTHPMVTQLAARVV